MKSTVYDCNILSLGQQGGGNDRTIAIENNRSIPFDVKRIYYLYDVPYAESRGAHAHKELFQLVMAINGSFDVTLDDGNVKRTVFLNNPLRGLLIVPGIWRDLNNFSSGAVCLVLASRVYEESDYIRDYEDFKIFIKGGLE